MVGDSSKSDLGRRRMVPLETKETNPMLKCAREGKIHIQGEQHVF